MSRRLADLAIVAALVGYVMATVTLLWRHPWVLALLLCWPAVLLGSRMGSTRRAIAFAAAGLVLGPLTESACILLGLWTYAETGGLPLVPPWNFPLWTCFPAALWIVVRVTLGRSPRTTFRPLHLALPLLALAGQILLFDLLGHSTALTLAAVLPLTVLVLVIVRRLEIAIILLAGGLIGPLCESLPIAAGAWTYATQGFLGMPPWLPLGYGLFAVFTSLAAEQIGALALGREGTSTMEPAPR
jgi:hypothetical protein